MKRGQAIFELDDHLEVIRGVSYHQDHPLKRVLSILLGVLLKQKVLCRVTPVGRPSKCHVRHLTREA